MVSEGAMNIWKACSDIVHQHKGNVDLESWKKLISTSNENDDGNDEDLNVQADTEDQVSYTNFLAENTVKSRIY